VAPPHATSDADHPFVTLILRQFDQAAASLASGRQAELSDEVAAHLRAPDGDVARITVTGVADCWSLRTNFMGQLRAVSTLNSCWAGTHLIRHDHVNEVTTGSDFLGTHSAGR
jgi:hypothetical protein